MSAGWIGGVAGVALAGWGAFFLWRVRVERASVAAANFDRAFGRMVGSVLAAFDRFTETAARAADAFRRLGDELSKPCDLVVTVTVGESIGIQDDLDAYGAAYVVLRPDGTGERLDPYRVSVVVAEREASGG